LLKLNDNNSILLNGFFNQDGIDRVTVREGFNLIFDTDDLQFWPSSYRHSIFYTYNSRRVFSGFLKGNHQFGEGKNELTWLAGYTNNYDDLPENRALNYYQDTVSGEFLLRSSGLNRPENDPVALFYREISEDIFTGRVDYKRILNEQFYFKTGLYLERKLRDFQNTYYGYFNVPTSSGQLTIPDITRFQQPIKNRVDSIFNSWLIPDGSGVFLRESLPLYNTQFDSETSIYAGYLGLNYATANKKFSAYGGLRFEYFNQQITPLGLDSTVTEVERSAIAPDNSYWDIFPSINLTYNLSPQLKLRSSYGKTINRPFEREVLSTASFDLNLGYAVVGYPFLEPATIHNMDIRLEHYGNEGEVIAIGAFYKKFNNPIELVAYQLPEPDRELLPNEYFLSNSEGATNFGVEFEFRKNLSFIAPVMENFSVILNASFLRSRIELADSVERAFYRAQFDSIEVERFAFAPGIKRALTGTSPYMFNASLYYDNKKTKTTASLQYNIIGPRIIVPPVILNLNAPDFDNSTPDSVVFRVQEFFSPGIYEKPRHSLDLTIRQKLLKFVGLRFSIQNILNQPVHYFFDRNRNEKFDEPAEFVENRTDINDEDITAQRYFPGRYWTIGLSFIF